MEGLSVLHTLGSRAPVPVLPVPAGQGVLKEKHHTQLIPISTPHTSPWLAPRGLTPSTPWPPLSRLRYKVQIFTMVPSSASPWLLVLQTHWLSFCGFRTRQAHACPRAVFSALYAAPRATASLTLSPTQVPAPRSVLARGLSGPPPGLSMHPLP